MLAENGNQNRRYEMSNAQGIGTETEGKFFTLFVDDKEFHIEESTILAARSWILRASHARWGSSKCWKMVRRCRSGRTKSLSSSRVAGSKRRPALSGVSQP